jgi:hypothetical protein
MTDLVALRVLTAGFDEIPILICRRRAVSSLVDTIQTRPLTFSKSATSASTVLRMR